VFGFSDEIMYDAKIHPEQYSNTLSTAQIAQLHKSIHYVCSLAVETKADSSQFPEEWLFKHRWGKGKKDSANRLPNGAKIVFMTVGGRTSAVVPSVQKKTGKVAGDVKEEDKVDSETDGEVSDGTKNGQNKKPAKGKKSTKKAKAEEAEGTEVKEESQSEKKITKRSSRARKSDATEEKATPATKNGAPKSSKRKAATKEEPESKDAEGSAAETEQVAIEDEEAEIESELPSPPAKKQKHAAKASKKLSDGKQKPQRGTASAKLVAAPKEASDGRRRSARVSGVGA